MKTIKCLVAYRIAGCPDIENAFDVSIRFREPAPIEYVEAEVRETLQKAADLAADEIINHMKVIKK